MSCTQPVAADLVVLELGSAAWEPQGMKSLCLQSSQHLSAQLPLCFSCRHARFSGSFQIACGLRPSAWTLPCLDAPQGMALSFRASRSEEQGEAVLLK